MAPKRATSAFLFWSQVVRAKLKVQFPSLPNIELSRKLGILWANASDEEKAPYLEKEKADRNRYKEAMVKWRADAPVRKAQEEAHQQWVLQQQQHLQQQTAQQLLGMGRGLERASMTMAQGWHHGQHGQPDQLPAQDRC